MKPEGERKPVKKWETLNHIMAMANHTRTVLENRKIFDCSYRPRRGASQEEIREESRSYTPKYKEELLNRVAWLAQDVYLDAWEANSIKVLTPQDKEKRLALILQAASKAARLMAMIAQLRVVFHLRRQKAQHWYTLVRNARAEILDWYAINLEMYKDI